MLAYYLRWLNTALSGWPRACDGIAATAALVLNLLVNVMDESFLEAIKQLWPQAAVWIFVGILFARFLLAPYWMHREDAAKQPATPAPVNPETALPPETHRLREVRALLQKSARRAPWIARPGAIARWFDEVAIQLELTVKGMVYLSFQNCKTIPKGKAFLLAMASRLHEDDLRKYPDA